MELKSHIKNCQSKSRFLQKYYCLPAVCGVVEKMKAKKSGGYDSSRQGQHPDCLSPVFDSGMLVNPWRRPVPAAAHFIVTPSR
jgi:hypothetical protein